MKILGVVLGLAGLAVLAYAAWVMAWAGGAPLEVLTYGSSLAVMVNVVLALWAVVLLFIGRTLPASADQLVWIPVGLGALVTAYGVWNVWQAMQITNTTNLQVVAPSFAGALPPLAIGLIAGCVAVLARPARPLRG